MRGPDRAVTEPADKRAPRFGREFFLSPSGWPYLLVPFIPAAIALELAHAAAGLVFFSAALG